MNGVLNGGWGFVLAAYLISAIVLVSYAGRTIALFRASARRPQ